MELGVDRLANSVSARFLWADLAQRLRRRRRVAAFAERRLSRPLRLPFGALKDAF